MTGTTTSSASNAVNEVVNGNLSYGNVNLGNSQMGNVSKLQRNMNSLIGSGGHRLDTGGVQITNDAKGWSVMNRMQDTGIANFRGSLSSILTAHERLNEARSWTKSANTRLSEGESVMNSLAARSYEQVAQMKTDEISQRLGISADRAQSISNAWRYMDSQMNGRNYSSGTGAQGNLSLSGGIGGNLGFSKTNMGDSGTDKAAETLKGLQANLSINGGIETGVNAGNTKLYGSQEQIAKDQAYNEQKSIAENGLKMLAASERNDETTGLAREWSSSKQNVNSLMREKTNAENELKQAEIGFQRMKQSAVTFDENITDDFVGIAQERYDLSENQSKELLNSHRPEDQAIRRKLIDATIERTAVRNRIDLPDIKTPERSGNLDFNESNLEN